MTDRLAVYNGALRALGSRRLASLAENREPRRVLDDAWDGGFVRACLEQGEWNFATRTARLDYDPDYAPGFGHRYVFAKGDDWARTAGVFSDESCLAPVTRYADEAGLLFADLPTLYVRYVSDDDAYGGDLSRWPESFAAFAQLSLADMASARLLQDPQREDRIKRDLRRALADARSADVMGRPARFLPAGTWSGARRGNRFCDPAEGR